MILMNYSRSMVEGFVFLSTIVTAANLPLYLCASLALIVRGSRAATTVMLSGPPSAFAVDTSRRHAIWRSLSSAKARPISSPP